LRKFDDVFIQSLCNAEKERLFTLQQFLPSLTPTPLPSQEQQALLTEQNCKTEEKRFLISTYKSIPLVTKTPKQKKQTQIEQSFI
jgi:hypothetical protein